VPAETQIIDTTSPSPALPSPLGETQRRVNFSQAVGEEENKMMKGGATVGSFGVHSEEVGMNEHNTDTKFGTFKLPPIAKFGQGIVSKTIH
jgi:hypothetical protein